MRTTRTAEVEGRIWHGSSRHVSAFTGHLSPSIGDERCSEVFTAFWRILNVVAVASFTLCAVIVVVGAIDSVFVVIELTPCRRRGRLNSDMARKWHDVGRKFHRPRSSSTTSCTSNCSTTCRSNIWDVGSIVGGGCMQRSATRAGGATTASALVGWDKGGWGEV
jgi:hypothetical protein